jgi:hypothetical protein
LMLSERFKSFLIYELNHRDSLEWYLYLCVYPVIKKGILER